jgi:hypothetical protein
MKQFLLLSVCLIVTMTLSLVGCGSSSPSEPSAVVVPRAVVAPVVVPPVVVPPVVPAIAALTITDVSPNPVPWKLNGAVSCLTSTRVNTWSYTLTIRETAGVAVTLTHYTDVPEFPQQTAINPVITVPARGAVQRFPNQCWTQGSGHTSQITYFGTDANGNSVSVAGPVVTLTKR